MDMFDTLMARQLGAGGGGGTTNYNALENKPEINGETLQGDKNSTELKIAGKIVDGGTGEVFNDYSDNVASGNFSHAEGAGTVASGNRAHAEGITTTASGNDSHAEGGTTTASGVASHAEGYHTAASAYYAHAEGGSTTASANFSHAEGNNTKASSNAQHVQGKYNIEDSAGKYAFIIGNGTADNARSNALAVDWNGDIYPANYGKGVNLAQLDADVAALRLALDAEVYGFRIDKQDSNPVTRVTYMYDAVGKNPVGMDFVNGVFNYGGWADAWFVKGAKPCALRADGTVAYYLNPDDYTKKADGTASDISDTTTELNFMVEFPTVWIKRWEDTRYQYVAIANKQIDDDFKAYAHMSEDGYVNDFIYFPMFKGSNISDKMRSIAGQYPQTNTNASNTFVLARANGNDWYNWVLSGRAMINDLLTLISKATNSQRLFGNGVMYNSGDTTHYGMIETGLDDLTTGQFFGYTGSKYSKHVKVFHIEDYWGNRADRILGIHLVDGAYKYKLTPPYQSGGAGEIQTNLECAGAGYFSEMYLGDFGFLPKPSETVGDGSTYWCDYFNCNKSGTMVAISPFHSYGTPARNGYESASIHVNTTYSSELVGGSLMYIPPHST